MRFEPRLVGTVVLACVASIAGCATPPTGVPLDPQFAKNDPESQIEFWHALPERKLVTNDEAFHALLLFVDGEDSAADYEGRVGALKQKRMLPGGFRGAPADALRRGTLAVALARALSIKGGLSMHLFGATPRYAVRELQYAGVYPPSSPQQTFSGPEFLGIIGRAEDYQRAKTEDVLAPAMPDEAAADGGA
jgi:hypothetical protein